MTGVAPAAGEPDEPNRGDSPDATAATHHPDAIWKSVLGATGSFGCERETYYRETVRDANGYRLRFPANADIIFGVAIDVLHTRLTEWRMEHGPIDASTIGVDLGDGDVITERAIREEVREAARLAVGAARGRGLDQPMDDIEWQAFAESILLAGEKLVGLWPNRVKANGEPDPKFDTAPPIGWLDPEPGTVLHPQHRLYVPGVVGGRGLSGRPDYVILSAADGSIVGWADVKALTRAGSYPSKWTAGEAVAYDYMATFDNGGVVPDWHAYIEYRRVAKPYWAIERAPVAPASVRLAESYMRRWEVAFNVADPDGVSFNPKACGKCQYRDPIPGLHDGCPIGGPSLDVAPAPEDDR